MHKTSLHWLPVRLRIDFIIPLITFKARLAPCCLTDLLTPYEQVSSLRSSGRGLLVLPKTKLKTKGDRVFAVKATYQRESDRLALCLLNLR